MNALSSEQLSPLYRREVFRSRHADETHARVTAELKEHRSLWGREPVDAAFCRAELGPLSLCILRYGCAVDIEPDALGSFVLVQMPLRGHAEIRTGRDTVQIHPGQGAVISAHKPVKLRWHAGCEQLMLKIRRSHLDEVARRAFAPRGGRHGGEIEFATGFRLDDGFGAQWRHLVAGLIALLPSEHGASFDPQWVEDYQDSLVHYLLRHQPNSARRGHDDAPSVETPAVAAAPLRRAEEFMRSRLGEGQSLDDIARAAGVSRRTLSLMFRRHREQSPMEALRNMRLDAAHEQLQRRAAETVTDVALNCGFAHLSRFAASYRARFGQLPHATWREAEKRFCGTA